MNTLSRPAPPGADVVAGTLTGGLPYLRLAGGPVDADLAHDTTAALPSLRAPTLVIGGALDPAFPEALLRETAALIPGARLRVFPGVGHDVADERKRAFEAEVLAFLREQARR